jgi:hypothetical protein
MDYISDGKKAKAILTNKKFIERAIDELFGINI